MIHTQGAEHRDRHHEGNRGDRSDRAVEERGRKKTDAHGEQNEMTVIEAWSEEAGVFAEADSSARDRDRADQQRLPEIDEAEEASPPLGAEALEQIVVGAAGTREL